MWGAVGVGASFGKFVQRFAAGLECAVVACPGCGRTEWGVGLPYRSPAQKCLTTSQQVCMLPLGCTAGGFNSELESVRYCHAIGSVGPKCRNSKTSTEI